MSLDSFNFPKTFFRESERTRKRAKKKKRQRHKNGIITLNISLLKLEANRC